METKTNSKYKYPVVKQNATRQDTRYQGIASYVLEQVEYMKRAREYKETEWRNANQVYQGVMKSYKLAFDTNVAPEIQYGIADKRMTDINLPVEFAIIQRKLTYIRSNAPKPKWVSLNREKKDSERNSKGKMFGYIFDYVWYLCDGDWEEFKAIVSALIYGNGYLNWYHEYYVQEVEIPDTFDENTGMIIYKTITKVVSQTKVRNMDIRHVLLDQNASDISQIEQGAIIAHYGEETFKTLFKHREIEGIMPIDPMECFFKVGEEKIGRGKKVYEVIHYYHEGSDRYAEVVNGYHINPYRATRANPENAGWSPIPSTDKKFPIAFWIDHYLDSELYAMGECRLAKDLAYLKNKSRNMIFDVMKKIAFQTLIIDPASEFDEDEYEFGQSFIRIEPDEVKPMPVSANLEFTNEMDQRINDDIAIFTGINIADTANPKQDETATKTAARRESQFAVIENFIDQNMTNGWKRLWVGMKNTIRIANRVPQLDDEGNTHGFMVRTDGVKLFPSSSGVHEQKMEGSYFYETKPEDYDDDMDLIPEMSNIAYTTELENQLKSEAIATMKNYPPDAGVVNLFKLAEVEAELGKLPKDVVNPAPNTKANEPDLNQDYKSITKGLDLVAKPPQFEEMAAKAMGQMQNPEQGTPSERIPEGGSLPGMQATAKPNPAVVV